MGPRAARASGGPTRDILARRPRGRADAQAEATLSGRPQGGRHRLVRRSARFMVEFRSARRDRPGGARASAARAGIDPRARRARRQARARARGGQGGAREAPRREAPGTRTRHRAGRRGRPRVADRRGGCPLKPAAATSGASEEALHGASIRKRSSLPAASGASAAGYSGPGAPPPTRRSCAAAAAARRSPAEPPWVVPDVRDLVAVALRWSAAHALRAADRRPRAAAARRQNLFSPRYLPERPRVTSALRPLLPPSSARRSARAWRRPAGRARRPRAGCRRVRSRGADARRGVPRRARRARSEPKAASSFQTNDLVLLEKKSSAASTAAGANRGGASRPSRNRPRASDERAVPRVRRRGGARETGAQSRAGSRSWSGARRGRPLVRGRLARQTPRPRARSEEFLPAATVAHRERRRASERAGRARAAGGVMRRSWCCRSRRGAHRPLPGRRDAAPRAPSAPRHLAGATRDASEAGRGRAGARAVELAFTRSLHVVRLVTRRRRRRVRTGPEAARRALPQMIGLARPPPPRAAEADSWTARPSWPAYQHARRRRSTRSGRRSRFVAATVDGRHGATSDLVVQTSSSKNACFGVLHLRPGRVAPGVRRVAPGRPPARG